MNTLTKFEKDIQQTFRLPEPRPEFLSNLAARISKPYQPKHAQQARIRLAWTVLAIVAVLLVTIASIGPGKVWAQLQSWLGLHPDVGLIQPDTPLRVLKAPVSMTREGVTIEVYDATLSPEMTVIRYSVRDVPSSAYPQNENISGCIEPQYLEASDGRRFQAYGDSEYEIIPFDVYEVELVIPCIHNTIPGTVPENWRIQLEFVLSDTPLNLTPVYIAPEKVTPTQPGQTDESDLPGSQARLLVSHSLVEGDNLILAGFIRGLGQEYRNQVGSLEVLDANGQPVPWVYSYEPSGIANAYANEIGFWMIRIKPAGLAFPLEIRRSYEERSQPLPDEKTSITIHFPEEIPNFDLPIKQSFILAGETMELFFIREQPSQFGGYDYDFYFKAHPVIKTLSVEAPGSKPPTMTASGDHVMHGEEVFMSGLWMPDGKLLGDIEITFSEPIKVLEPITLSQSFTPPADLIDQLETLNPDDQACITFNNYGDPNQIAGAIPEGKILIYGEPAPLASYQLALYSLDGSLIDVIGENMTHSTISPDGSSVVYFVQDQGLWRYDLATDSRWQVNPLQGYDLHWSPDGQWIAFKGYGVDSLAVTLINLDSNQVLALPEENAGGIITWSADSQRVYIRVADSSDSRGRLFVYDLSTSSASVSDLLDAGKHIPSSFTLSPDEKHALVANGNRDWSLIDLETGQEKLLTEGLLLVDPLWVGQDWIVFSRLDQQQSKPLPPILINPQTCQVIHLPEELSGKVFGIWLDQ